MPAHTIQHYVTKQTTSQNAGALQGGDALGARSLEHWAPWRELPAQYSLWKTVASRMATGRVHGGAPCRGELDCWSTGQGPDVFVIDAKIAGHPGLRQFSPGSRVALWQLQSGRAGSFRVPATFGGTAPWPR
jgi:hypothetical protein